jgi:hypothetical protein
MERPALLFVKLLGIAFGAVMVLGVLIMAAPVVKWLVP